MTPPMTPREKVEPSLDDLLKQASEMMEKWTPEERAAHFEAQKKAIVAAEMAFGDEGTRTVSTPALASGSGDHAELVEISTRCEEHWWSGPQDQAAIGVVVRRADLEALLTENAALRGDLAKTERDFSELRDSYDAVSNKLCVERAHGSRETKRATEAERKLAEAVGLLRDLASWFDGSAYNGAWVIRSGDLGVDDAICAARTFLSKEAER